MIKKYLFKESAFITKHFFGKPTKESIETICNQLFKHDVFKEETMQNKIKEAAKDLNSSVTF